MPQSKEVHKEYMRLKRQGSQGGGAMLTMAPASYVEGLNGIKYEFLPKRPRYLTLSDRQVLDRANQPSPKLVSGVMIQAMRHSNEVSLDYHPNTGVLSTELRKLARLT